MPPDEQQEFQFAEAGPSVSDELFDLELPEADFPDALAEEQYLSELATEAPDLYEDPADLEEELRMALLEAYPDATSVEIEESLFNVLVPLAPAESTREAVQAQKQARSLNPAGTVDPVSVTTSGSRMENLFRLMLARPAVAQDLDNPSIDLTQESAYQVALRKALDDGRTQVEEITNAFVAGANFIGAPADNPLATQLAHLAARLDQMSDDDVAPDAVAHAIQSAFRASPHDVVAGDAFQGALARLRDSVIAVKLLQEQHARPIEELVRQLRSMDVVARVAADKTFPSSADELRRWRRRSLRLPVELGFRSRLSTREAEQELRKRRQAAVDERSEQVKDLIAEHEGLRAAISELGALEPQHFRVSDRVESEAVLPPEPLRLKNAVTGGSAYTQGVRHLNLRQMERSIDGQNGEGPKVVGTIESGSTAALAQTLLSTTSAILAGRQAFQPPDVTEVGFLLKPTAVHALSQGTRAFLEKRSIDLSAAPLDRIAERLQGDLTATVTRLEQVAGHPVKQSFTRIGDALVSIQTPITTGWGAIGTGGLVSLPYSPWTDGSRTPRGPWPPREWPTF